MIIKKKTKSLKKEQRGLSLIEVSLYIIVFTISLVIITDSINIHLKSKKKEEIINGIQQFNDAFKQYIIDNQIDFLSSKEATPHAMSFDDLKKMGYLPQQMTDSNYMTFSSTGYVIQKNVARVLDNIGRPQLVGIVITCPQNGIQSNPYVLRGIINQLGVSAGMMEENQSRIIGSHGIWEISRQDRPSGVPLFEQGAGCIYSLLTDVSYFHEKGAIQPPEFLNSKISVEAFSAGHKIPLQSGEAWYPLFNTDVLHLFNNNKAKHIRIDLEDQNNSLLYSNFFNSSDIKISPGYFQSGKKASSIFGKKFKIKITPFDDFQHPGKSVYLFNGSPITIKRYQGSIWNSFSIKMGVNIYNKNYKIPINPVGNTRSDIGYCSDENKKDIVTPMGIDIIGMDIDLIMPEQKEASYIEPQTIAIIVDNAANPPPDPDPDPDPDPGPSSEPKPLPDIDTGPKRIFILTLKSPTDLHSDPMEWGSYDRRFTQPPLIGNAVLSNTLYYRISKACQTSMSGEASVYIKTNTARKKIDSIAWDAGQASTWGYHDIPIK
ncbi:hypothetical protein [Serratia sp. UGAL515B_01]|uniref:type II secretion system protein n=1 Tax=Serratia sp. UGAL515B_01 TaxID=2986763 RepID=UPI0029542587|nr:hypothetical protein [Serratia sp. UGAL515B_01]WON76969.1 hypothetical protein OK023_17640 [Serratia sp. UGAL515B_01]